MVFSRIVGTGSITNYENVKPSTVFSLLSDSDAQQRAFTALAGKNMGGARRGHTYTWLPNHLSGARGEASPRSFLMALRKAAETTAEDYVTPLSHIALRDSVAEASQNRIEELAGDHPWLGDVIDALRGLTVPAERDDVYAKFDAADLRRRLCTPSEGDIPRIPVELTGIGAGDRNFNDQLLEALKRLYLVERRPDGRINVPDLFQVAAGLKRKGGIPPRK